MDENFTLRIRRVTNGYIVDMSDGPMFIGKQAVFHNAKELAEALPLLLNDPPMVREEPKAE